LSVGLISITLQYSHNEISVSKSGCTINQVVESCDCVDEETECTGACVQGEERIKQVLSVDGNTSEEFAIGIIIDRPTGESCRLLSPVTQFCIGLLS